MKIKKNDTPVVHITRSTLWLRVVPLFLAIAVVGRTACSQATQQSSRILLPTSLLEPIEAVAHVDEVAIVSGFVTEIEHGEDGDIRLYFRDRQSGARARFTALVNHEIIDEWKTFSGEDSFLHGRTFVEGKIAMKAAIPTILVQSRDQLWRTGRSCSVTEAYQMIGSEGDFYGKVAAVIVNEDGSIKLEFDRSVARPGAEGRPLVVALRRSMFNDWIAAHREGLLHQNIVITGTPGLQDGVPIVKVVSPLQMERVFDILSPADAVDHLGEEQCYGCKIKGIDHLPSGDVRLSVDASAGSNLTITVPFDVYSAFVKLTKFDFAVSETFNFTGIVKSEQMGFDLIVSSPHKIGIHSRVRRELTDKK